jgi:hypothetical protein
MTRDGPPPPALPVHPAGDKVIVSGRPGVRLYLSIAHPDVVCGAVSRFPTATGPPPVIPEIEIAASLEGDPFSGGFEIYTGRVPVARLSVVAQARLRAYVQDV